MRTIEEITRLSKTMSKEELNLTKDEQWEVFKNNLKYLMGHFGNKENTEKNETKIH